MDQFYKFATTKKKSVDKTVFPSHFSSQAVSTLTDLLRDNLRNNKVKQFLLPPLGEFLYLVASQVDIA